MHVGDLFGPTPALLHQLTLVFIGRAMMRRRQRFWNCEAGLNQNRLEPKWRGEGWGGEF